MEADSNIINLLYQLSKDVSWDRGSLQMLPLIVLALVNQTGYRRDMI